MFDLSGVGKILIFFGAILIIFGGIIVLVSRFFPLGKILPGDIYYRSPKGNFTFYFPIVTCILISIVLTLLFLLISWLSRGVRK